MSESLIVQGRVVGPAGPGVAPSLAGAKSGLESAPFVAGVGDALGLAQWRGAVERHGGAHAPAQVAPARPDCPAAAPPDAHQSDAVPGRGQRWGPGISVPLTCGLAQLGG